MKLWEVTIERAIFVLAETEREAEHVAERNEGEESYNPADCVWAREITDPKQISLPWRDSLPYGKNNDLTCEEFLKTLELLTEKEDGTNLLL